MIINKDICDEIDKDYICQDDFFDESNNDNEKKMEDNSQIEESGITVNCNLKVDFDTKNKMIYLCPGKAQYFTVDVQNCCGDVTIKYKGNCHSKGIRGNLGIYHIVPSGILVEAYSKADIRKNDILNFIAIDECTKECSDFVVIFSSNLGGCYC